MWIKKKNSISRYSWKGSDFVETDRILRIDVKLRAPKESPFAVINEIGQISCYWRTKTDFLKTVKYLVTKKRVLFLETVRL